VEAVERREHRLERGPFQLQRLRDRHLLVLGVRVHLRPAPALRFQPAVQFLQAREPQPGLEEPPSDRLDLMLDLTLLPTGRRRAGGWLDHVMIRHHQEATVEHALLADEHGRHRGLHVVVDAAQRHSSEEGEAARMRVEHHLLRLARIRSNVHRPRRAQPHMRDLHAHRLARDLHVFVAPVELVRLALPEQQRDKCRHAGAGILTPRLGPARSVAPDRIVRSLEAFAQQQIVDPRHPQPIATRARLVLGEQCIEPFLERSDPRQRLHRPMIIERTFRCPDRLAHHLARQSKIPRDRLDRLAAGVLTPNPNHSLHHQHPDLAA
jgi:hypothetical protein